MKDFKGSKTKKVGSNSRDDSASLVHNGAGVERISSNKRVGGDKSGSPCGWDAWKR